MKSFMFLSVLWVSLETSASIEINATLPSESVRTEAFLEMAETMERLDGEALYVRSNRPLTWQNQVRLLSEQAKHAKTAQELMRVFHRLDASYPNLHSKIRPGKNYNDLVPNRARPQIRFLSEWIQENKIRHRLYIVKPGVEAAVGDEVIAVNGRPMSEWETEHFEFCKLPLKAQCDANLSDAFQKELLSWKREIPLLYTLKRGEKVWTISVALEDYTSQPPPLQQIYCKYSPDRYANFKLMYAGNRACVYQHKSNPGVAILRITSFAYPGDFLEPGEKITSAPKEIEALYPWWVEHANWEHLILDVIDNHGGEAPIPYYQILLQKDFQEQYVTFKKMREMELPQIRKSLFWGERGQEIWFQNLVASGIWHSLREGEKTPHVPMFCVDSDRDCSEGLFPVRKHPFRGRVSVLVNEWCVSSCDGFVYTMREELGAKSRFFGRPQAADSAYSRLQVNLEFSPRYVKGYDITVAPLMEPVKDNAFVSQIVVVTQSAKSSGEIVSGIPVAIDHFVPMTLENANQWPNVVVEEAIRH